MLCHTSFADLKSNTPIIFNQLQVINVIKLSIRAVACRDLVMPVANCLIVCPPPKLSNTQECANSAIALLFSGLPRIFKRKGPN